jgi:hypothetical protein
MYSNGKKKGIFYFLELRQAKLTFLRVLIVLATVEVLVLVFIFVVFFNF